MVFSQRTTLAFASGVVSRARRGSLRRFCFCCEPASTKGLLPKSEVRIRTDYVTLWVRGRESYRLNP